MSPRNHFHYLRQSKTGLPLKQVWVSYIERGNMEGCRQGRGSLYLPLPLPDHSLNLDLLPL